MDNDSINGIKSLMKEAQKINNSWLNLARVESDASKIKLEHDDPFIEDDNQIATRIGYIYKIWKIQEENEELGKKEKKICIRCQVHTHIGKDEDGDPRYMNVYALNEHTTNRTNWRATIDKQTTAALNKETEDNSFRVSRWIVQSLLSDAEFMKLAFISRKDLSDKPDSNQKHVVLATYTINTQKWAKQINMKLDNMWNIIKYIIECIEDDKQLKANKDL